jgi:hypothetical protein
MMLPQALLHRSNEAVLCCYCCPPLLQVLYNKINKVMVPPCGNDDMCYAAFNKP